jgi:pyruvate carboxylase
VVDLQKTALQVEKKIGRKPAHDEVLSYLMYPDVFVKFAQNHQSWGDIEVLATPQFYYGMTPGSEISVALDPGRVLVLKFFTVGEPHPDGTRTVFFELNGQPREVTVRDRKLEVKTPARPKADLSQPGHVGAPMPGMISSISVEPGQTIRKGERLLVLEAMKMQSTVYANYPGKIKQILVQPGQRVETKDLLIVIG